jgi:hypothetical protein
MEHREAPGGVACYYLKWQSATDGTFTAALDECPYLSGRLIMLVTKPSATAPTDDYDITLVSSMDGHDLLAGRGVNRDTALTESTLIMQEVTVGANTYADHPLVNEAKPVLTISGAGDTKIGEIWIYLE